MWSLTYILLHHGPTSSLTILITPSSKSIFSQISPNKLLATEESQSFIVELGFTVIFCAPLSFLLLVDFPEYNLNHAVHNLVSSCSVKKMIDNDFTVEQRKQWPHQTCVQTSFPTWYLLYYILHLCNSSGKNLMAFESSSFVGHLGLWPALWITYPWYRNPRAAITFFSSTTEPWNRVLELIFFWLSSCFLNKSAHTKLN